MNSFIRKVEAERSILAAVNIHTKGKEQLAGLSTLAINNWCAFHKIEPNGKISNTLHNLADLCNSLSDKSNENFVNIPTERLRDIKKELLVLIKSLADNFQENT